jgi:hypothetical protein
MALAVVQNTRAVSKLLASEDREKEDWILRSQIRETEMVVVTRVRGFIVELR